MSGNGLIYVFSGEGKGKTSAAIGTAIRALLEEKNVTWIAFYKQEKWGIAEAKLKTKFDQLDIQFVGLGFKIKSALSKQVSDKVKVVPIANRQIVVDTSSEEEHIMAASRGLSRAKEALEKKPFLLVLDEVLNAVNDQLIKESEIIDLLKNRGRTHVVLTGRGVTKNIIEQADLVTECRKIKHPYDSGKLAVKGLDFKVIFDV